MVDILPFRGLRYNTGFADATVFSPPYDVIDESMRERLLARNPRNIVRLTLGSSPGDRSWYDHAADTMARWRQEGILVQDDEPVLYGYQQHFAGRDGSRRVRHGFVTRIALRPWGDGIHRHEHTKSGPKADRLRLMRAMRANMSPVFGLYRDETLELQRHLAPPERVLVDVVDADGVRHVFWAIRDKASIRNLVDGMATRDVIIADGHHRYETALAYQAECRARHSDPEGLQPYDSTLMYLTAIEDPGLRILASHRLVASRPPVDEEALLSALSEQFHVRPAVGEGPLEDEVAASANGTVAIGACLGDGSEYILTLKDLSAAHQAAAGRIADELADLDVAVLQNMILEPHLGISRDMLVHGERITYTINQRVACERVRQGLAAAAFVLNPTRLDQVWLAAEHGVTMPQKSTYFYPKLLTGLVIGLMDEQERSAAS